MAAKTPTGSTAGFATGLERFCSGPFRPKKVSPTYPPLISVIIPTYNRPENLKRTLQSLALQELAEGTFEVIVVDDGSDLSTSAQSLYPFQFTILQQHNQGPTRARNLGAQHSQAEILVFLDDDICVNPTGLAALLKHCQEARKTIFLGSLLLPNEILQTSPFARAFDLPTPSTDQDIHYTFCKTGLLALRKDDFVELGMFQDPTGGWPNWDDVDFGYRAHQKGFRIRLCVEAQGEHWDYASRSLQQASQRLQRAATSAVRLFQVYPDLQDELPMFRDMLPYRPDKDSVRLAVRKLARRLASTRPLLWTIECLAALLEKFQLFSQNKPEHLVGSSERVGSNLPLLPLRRYSSAGKDSFSVSIMRTLYTWVTGGYIYRGIQDGLHKYGALCLD